MTLETQTKEIVDKIVNTVPDGKTIESYEISWEQHQEPGNSITHYTYTPIVKVILVDKKPRIDWSK